MYDRFFEKKKEILASHCLLQENCMFIVDVFTNEHDIKADFIIT